jgi:hypothetical protein
MIRPQWCPHQDCRFQVQFQEAMCGGDLPAPSEHDGDFNHHRLCLAGAADNGGVFDLQINKTDIFHLRRIFDKLQQASSSTHGGAASAEPSPNPSPSPSPIKGEAPSLELREALEDGCEAYCGLHCPSVKKTGDEWPHTKRCLEIRAIVSRLAQEGA